MNWLTLGHVNISSKEKYAEEPTKEGETCEEIKPEDEVKVISGVTNVRLLLSQEPERNLSEDDEEPEEIKLAKISAEMRDKQGKVEQNLLSKLNSVKHKWRDKLTREQITNKYRHSPETGVSSHYKFSNNYIRIDGSCENPEL